MPPLSLDDDELSDLMHLAQAVPVDHRSAFLKAVASALGDYPSFGPGIVYRTAAALQRDFVNVPPVRQEERELAKTDGSGRWSV
jgi:hypothetical protein